MLSIITVTKNNLSGLKKTVKSVEKYLIKTKEIEHIIIDGLSDDGTSEFLETLQKIKYRIKKDTGIYEAMNRGIDASSGDAILFINAGDLLCTDIDLDKIIKKLDYKTKIYCFRCRLKYEDDEYIAPSTYKGDFSINHIVHQSIICPKKILIENKFNEMIPISADSEWKLKVLNKYGAIYREEILSEFELGGISNSASLRSTMKYLKQSSSYTEKLKHITKFLMRKLLGQKRMYQLLLSRKYTRNVR
jgi:glycosyltransferase involved in cell wall biosynthesis